MSDDEAPKRGRGRPKGSKNKTKGIGDNAGPSDDDIRIAVNELLDLKVDADLIHQKIGAKRKALKTDGFVMNILDRRIKMLNLTPQEQKTIHETDIRYGRALRQPVGDILDIFDADEGESEAEYGARYWYERGQQAGLAGTGWPDEPPEGCPPEHAQEWGRGHEAGSEEVRQAYLRRQQSVAVLPPVHEPDEPTEDEIEFA